MKWKGVFRCFFFLLVLAVLLVPGCKNCEVTNSGVDGKLLSYNGCKPLAASMSGNLNEVAGNQDCVEYSYNGQTLTLKHINSAFNCCPGEITADIDIDGNVITIRENEQEAGCLCLCLFDVEYEITNIESGEYTIFFYQLYLEEYDQVLEFTLQLTPGMSGTFCVPRNHYPWGN